MEAVMVRKLTDNFAFIGMTALFAGLLYYSVNNLWDWVAQAAVYGGAAFLVLHVVFNFSSLRAKLRSRTARYGSAAGAAVVLVLGILVLLNFLNFRHHKRVDLTENQLYALSEQSRRVVRNLDSDIQVIGFFQDETSGRRFQDLMREYRYSSSRVGFEVTDPLKSPGRAEEYNIDRAGQIAVVRGTRTELIDEISEEKITNAIIKVTRKTEKVVYFLEGHGERELNDTSARGLSGVREGLERQNYVVRSYNLAQEGEIPSDATVIVSAGPQVSFLPHQEQLLKEYLAGGGKLLLMVDPRTDFEMDEFLANHGLRLGKNLVIDASGIGQFFGIGPAAPIVADYGDHPITSELRGIMSFYPVSQSVHSVDSPLGYETTEILRTSPRSWGESDLQAAEAVFDEGKDIRGPLSLAGVAVNRVDAAETRTVADAEEEGDEPAGLESRLVVFGDSDFASNAYVNTASNRDVFLNTVSWLAEDTELVAPRPRSPEDRRVNLTFSQSRMIFWWTVVLLPLATLVFGIGIWYRRR
jgi:ABC-type uncharacterized transport system involved in gliding motility auxiliary subunit